MYCSRRISKRVGMVLEAISLTFLAFPLEAWGTAQQIVFCIVISFNRVQKVDRRDENIKGIQLKRMVDRIRRFQVLFLYGYQKIPCQGYFCFFFISSLNALRIEVLS